MKFENIWGRRKNDRFAECSIQYLCLCWFPITVFIVLLAKSKKLNTELKIFIVGICTYLAAQILFRQPLLAILQNIDSYRILISTNRVAYVAVLAVTAACAEEVGRYIAFRFFVKNPEQQNTPLYFGLGHGGIEALSVGVNNVILLVCSPYTLINMGADVALAGVERISTLLAQVAFSYIVFCSYRKENIAIWYWQSSFIQHTIFLLYCLITVFLHLYLKLDFSFFLQYYSCLH